MLYLSSATLSRPSGSCVINQNNILHIWINKSRTMWPTTEILMQYLTFSDNLFQDAYITFQNSADDFEIAQKTG